MNTPIGPSPSDDRDVRHSVELAKLQAEAQVRAAAARDPGEWFDIFADITALGVKQTLELSLGATEAAAQYDRLMKEQRPFLARVRRDLVSHGLPLLEEIEFEGPEVAHDELGRPHIVRWPRGVWIEISWPTAGTRGDKLRFEGQAAVVALAFFQWWVGFQQVAQKQAGIDSTKRRIVAPGTAEYVSYMSAKARDRG